MKKSYLKLFLLVFAIICLGIAIFLSYTSLKKYFSFTQTVRNYRDSIIKPYTEEDVVKPNTYSYDPIKGSSEAKLSIYVFADFTCPACQEIQYDLNSVLSYYGKKVNLVWKDFPIENTHALTKKAALAARCAQEQGQFWEYHDLLFSKNNQLTENDFTSFAQQLNLELNSFNSCLETKKYNNIIQATFEQGAISGIDSSPTLFIGKKKIEWPTDETSLRLIIENELN